MNAQSRVSITRMPSLMTFDCNGHQESSAPSLKATTPGWTCKEIDTQFRLLRSATQVFCLGLPVTPYQTRIPTYDDATSHNWATSSTQKSACAAEPAAPGLCTRTHTSISSVLGNILVGTPFFVRHPLLDEECHCTESATRSRVMDAPPTLDSPKSLAPTSPWNASRKCPVSALVSAGLIWDEVYEALDAIGASMVGGCVTGVRFP